MALFPPGYERLCYVEPFCGSAAVLFAKKRSACEYLNDRDEEVVNFLLTVKLHSHELYRTLRLLPNSRTLFAQFLDAKSLPSSILRAARFLYINQVSFGGLGENWAYQGHRGGQIWLSAIERKVLRSASRLKDVILDCTTWQECVRKLDGPDTLFYFDPPYLETVGYTHVFTEHDWKELRGWLQTVQGKFVLSAEGTEMIKLLFRGFHERLTNVAGSLGPYNKRQKELLVWNFDAPA